MTILYVSLAVLVCPLTAGVLAGLLLAYLHGDRFAGVIYALVFLIVPTALATVATIYFPLVGLWDGMLEGLLCGAGIILAAHRSYADPRNAGLTAVSVIVAFALVEVGARVLLRDPPAYPIGGEGPHFLLANVLRNTGPDSATFHMGEMPDFVEKNAMHGDLGGARMTDRPPGAMVTKEIVCSIAYGEAYTGVVDVSREREVVFPHTIATRPETSRRVVHVGDSMVFGANVARDQTFAVNLEKLEPGVQHINGGISGMAPDDYLVVLRRWVERVPVDLAVMYLFAGNDIIALDAPHPCSNWQSLLVYDDGHAKLRFPSAPRSERGIGLRWLLINSPLPFLGRVMILGGSTSAAFLGALLDSWSVQATFVPADVQFGHLESILRTARDELSAKHIRFVVVVLPAAGAIDWQGGPSESLSQETLAITRRLGISGLDATDVIRASLARGQHAIQADNVHFTEEGHRLMAEWLHEQLASAAEGNAK